MRVSDDLSASADAVLMENFRQEGKRDTNDPPSCFHCPVKLEAFRRPAISKPVTEAVDEDALNGALVEGVKVPGGEAAEWVENLDLSIVV